jgi:hypothetical protein
MLQRKKYSYIITEKCLLFMKPADCEIIGNLFSKKLNKTSPEIKKATKLLPKNTPYFLGRHCI